MWHANFSGSVHQKVLLQVDSSFHVCFLTFFKLPGRCHLFSTDSAISLLQAVERVWCCYPSSHPFIWGSFPLLWLWEKGQLRNKDHQINSLRGYTPGNSPPLHTRPQTVQSRMENPQDLPLKIGRNCPKKGKDRLPTINFKVRLVSFREDISLLKKSWKRLVSRVTPGTLNNGTPLSQASPHIFRDSYGSGMEKSVGRGFHYPKIPLTVLTFADSFLRTTSSSSRCCQCFSDKMPVSWVGLSCGSNV